MQKKAGTSLDTLLNLEQLAYRGFMEYLHEYGGGPESFDDQACRHLEAYLRLVLQIKDGDEKDKLIEQLRLYIIKKTIRIPMTRTKRSKALPVSRLIANLRYFPFSHFR